MMNMVSQDYHQTSEDQSKMFKPSRKHAALATQTTDCRYSRKTFGDEFAETWQQLWSPESEAARQMDQIS
jgi:hypothetical protein